VAELPWFPVYRDDWIGSPTVAAMLPEQEGALWRLLLTSWGDGSAEPSLPIDDQQLATLSKLGPRWKKLGGLVRAQFEERAGRLYNAKLSAVWGEQTAKHTKASDKARTAALAKAEKRRLEDAQRNTQGTTPRSASSPAPSRTSSTPSGAAPSTQNLESTALGSTPHGVESQEQVPAPGGALAPAGAAPRATGATNGNGKRPGPSRVTDVVAQLADAGVEAFGEPERELFPLTMPQIEERRKLLEDAYWAQLRERADTWLAKHPEQATELERQERAHLGFPQTGTLKPWQERSLREALLEAYRILPRTHPIPSCRTWVAEREADGELAARPAPEDDGP
jgi:hypothetical protein